MLNAKEREFQRLMWVYVGGEGMSEPAAAMRVARERPDLVAADAQSAPVTLIEGGAMSKAKDEREVYPGWMRIDLFELDGGRVVDTKRRAEILLPHFLNAIGRPAAVPAGSASNFTLPPEARTLAWWGGEGSHVFYGDVAFQKGLISTPLIVGGGR